MPLRMRTLRDLQDNEGDGDEPEIPSLSTGGKVPLAKIKHIFSLSDADACLRLLTRIHKEFYPIIQRRGYNVVSLSEMCCCGDGLDSCAKQNKLKIMSSNVLGYNRTQSSSRTRRTHTIHLRLRNPQNHNVLFSYEQVAGTMAHELAHCVYGPHNAAFYKLMDEILDQHAVFLTKGIVADKDGFPMHSEQAYTLGGGTLSLERGEKKNTNKASLEAALRRQQQQRWMPQGPQVLGGDAGFCSWLAPGQAAGQAAEARRLRDEVWCQPCQPDDSEEEEEDVIELLSSDSEEDDKKPAAASADSNDSGKPAAVVTETESEGKVPSGSQVLKQRASDSKPAATKRPASVVTIDLTGSDDDDDEDDDKASVSNQVPTDHGRRKRPHHQDTVADTQEEWSCWTCTFRNLPGTLVCGMCGAESSLALEGTNRIVAEIRHKDEIENIKQKEVEQSQQEFGFNIYGNARQPTSKLPHLT